MSDFTARITEILDEHRATDEVTIHFPASRTYVECRCCGRRFRPEDFAGHHAELIAQAAEEHYRPRIENMEQLDALSAGTIIRDDEKNIHERLECWDDEASGSVWATTEKMWGTVGIAAPVIPALPVTVLWSPGAGE